MNLCAAITLERIQVQVFDESPKTLTQSSHDARR